MFFIIVVYEKDVLERTDNIQQKKQWIRRVKSCATKQIAKFNTLVKALTRDVKNFRTTHAVNRKKVSRTKNPAAYETTVLPAKTLSAHEKRFLDILCETKTKQEAYVKEKLEELMLAVKEVKMSEQLINDKRAECERALLLFYGHHILNLS